MVAADPTNAQQQESLGHWGRCGPWESSRDASLQWFSSSGRLLTAALTAMTRGHRLLGIERSQAVHDSLHDALTGQPNRTLRADRFGQAIRADARSGTRTGLILIDLDRFKEIHDTFGHHHSDELPAQVGTR